ncbi:glycosyltransferase family 87 protein [Xanthomonas nasturtii]|uniref:DUF2029 domain-containing protein n=1 Tax=Xanthomonas nasturtii TaxID=1843581 RepID=A0ABT0LUQ2_9XANT|nr:glycosyltransferase family 87 protein [Xanthomonas nasturtii]MCL1553069.1 DUF2029 domain-containing protein [Xanthomonas nasturtii]MCL1556574.1 DUF2029 domain-containing protein [Xanthomonas nasturtii]
MRGSFFALYQCYVTIRNFKIGLFLMAPGIQPQISKRLSWHRPEGFALYCTFIVLAAMVVVLKAGRDTPWDYLSYHAYSAYLLFHDRLAQDYFAAGLQGYMNPIGFLPFALTQLAGFNSIATGLLLATLHAMNGIFLLLICRHLARLTPSLTSVLIPGCFLGMVSPLLLSHLGSTFTDPVGSACVLGAVWLALSPSTPRRQFGAGIFIAAALAIKLSNAVFALAMLPVLLLALRHLGVREGARQCVYFAAGGALGLAVFQGYWSYKLYVLTGNPVFPFFNGLFQSPLIPTQSQSVGRFVPADFQDFLAIPLDLARYTSWGHLELPAPTIVPLAVVTVGLALAGKWLLVLMRRRRPVLEAVTPTVQLLLFCVISAVLWAFTSGNARYGLPLFLLAGPVLALLLNALCVKRFAVFVVWLVLLFQLFMTWDARIIRWRSQEWAQEWLSVDVPASLRNRPALFISLALQSQSNLVPYLHPDSSFVHLNNGHFTVPSTGPASVPFWRLLDRFGGRAKVVLQKPELLDQKIGVPRLVEQGENYLDRVSLRIVPGSCTAVAVNKAPGYRIGLNRNLSMPRGQDLLICDAVRSPMRYAVPRTRAEQIMNAFEDKCGDLFVPRRPQIELVGDVWVRVYPKYDSAVLIVSYDKHYISYLLTGQFNGVVLGTPETWKEDLKKFDCRLPYGGLRGYKGFAAEVGQHE